MSMAQAAGRLARLAVAVGVTGGLLAGCSSGGGGSGALCAQAKRIQNDRSLDHPTDAQAIQALKGLEAAAPGGLKDDLKTVTDGFQKINSGGLGAVTPAQSREIQAASVRIGRYLKNTCKIKSTV